MKITVFGASGKTGRHIIQQALEKGYDVTAYVRNKNSLAIEHPRLDVVTGQLNERDKIKGAIQGADACISALGGTSLRKPAREITEGIRVIISEMEQQGVKRFLYLSSIGAGDSRHFLPFPAQLIIVRIMLRIPIADHNTNETHIEQSRLEWTIFRPGGLTDGAISKKITSGAEKTRFKGNPSISRASLAAFMLEQLASEQWINKAVWVVGS